MQKDTTQTVEKISRINLSGNVIPHNWFKHIVKTTKTGKRKPDLLAINILSDIVYWYRAKETRDEHTGKIISLTKKFKSDKLQKSYSSYAEFFGFQKKTIKRSVDLLVQLGIITREFRKIYVPTCLSNVVFLEPVPEKIEKITFSEVAEDAIECMHPDNFVNTTDVGYCQNCQEGVAKIGNTYTEITNTETTVRKEKEYTPDCVSKNRGLISEDNQEDTISESLPDDLRLVEHASGLFPNTAQGVRTEKAFRQFFRNNYNKALIFLENMKITRKEELYSFFDEVQDYEVETLLSVFLDITNRVAQGYIDEYRPNYVLNAIELHLDDLFKGVTEVSDMVGKRVNPKLLDFCIGIFGNGQDALDVYRFYSFVLSSKKDKQGKEHKSLVERQKKNINTLVSDYGRDRFVKMVRQFKDGIDSGLVGNPSILHFSNYVKLWLKRKPAKSNKQTKSPVKKVPDGKVIPERYMRVGAVDQENGEFPPEREIYNWVYHCTCSAEIRAWNVSCPACGSDFLWEHVDKTVPEDKIQGEIDNDKRGACM